MTKKVIFLILFNFALLNIKGQIHNTIELISFNVNQVNNTVVLTWATSFEDSSLFYNIQRSPDNINFYSVDSILAAGNCLTLTNYLYNDSGPFLENGVLYYRLMVTFGNQTSMITPSIHIFYYNSIEENINSISWKIFPNPSKNYVTLEFEQNKYFHCFLIIYDMNGHEVLKINNFQSDQQKIYIDKI